MTHGNDLGYPPAMTKQPKGAAKAATKPKPPAAASTAAKALAAAPQEAHLDALLGQALAAAFPGIDRAKIRHQTTLTVRIGHQEKTFDAKAEWEGSGRADILIFHEDRCLAVVEVKRTTVKLALDDAAQAQSYANQFTPRPPLLIVTNGSETITYDSATGERWSVGSDAEKAVAKLLENATAVAAANMKWAVEVLLGPGADIWPGVVRDRTRELIARQTAPAGQGRKPFAEGLKLPRDATQKVLARLRAGVRFVLVDGPPLVGKSNVLRELAETTQTSEEFAVLFMRGGSTGLYQSIANILSSALEWEVTPDNVRQWLRRLSRFGRGPTLILTIDGLEPGNAMARDLEELADAGFGEKVRIVASIDDARRILFTGNNRNRTAINDQGAETVTVGPLSADEFKWAQDALTAAEIRFQPGALHSADYRAPWVLRVLYDGLVSMPGYDPKKGFFMMPATLGLAVIDHTHQVEVEHAYGLLARDYIDDVGEEPAGLALARSYAFVIRRAALSPASEACLGQLETNGWLTRYRNDDGLDLVAPTAPELFISELARAMSEALEQRAQDDPIAAAYWMAERLEATCFSDLIGAQAIRDLVNRTGGLNWRIIETLLAIEPETHQVNDTTVAFKAPDGRLVDLRVQEGRAWLVDKAGRQRSPAIDFEGETLKSYARLTPWMMLGQLAALPMAMDENPENRVDARLLFEVGQAPLPLLRDTGEKIGHLVHDFGDVSLLCRDNGVIEPTTAAMVRLLRSNWPYVDGWIDAAIDSGSLPLVNRIMIALSAIGSTVPSRSDWARSALADRVNPAIGALIDAQAKQAGVA
ncbi:hypothetical protein LTR94_019079 [Friedmanniomyces endolithicus]|nr:hypothetical protein LTR94_019079 [Friedmanniomyces endolithicus]